MALTEAQKRQIEAEERQRAEVLEAARLIRGEQKYGIPALLSFFIPGLGQIIKGQAGKGIGIFFGFSLSLLLVFTIIGVVVPIIIWIWQITDAYNTKPE